MHRRSKSVKTQKFSLVRYDIDGQVGVYRTDMLESEEERVSVGTVCNAPFKASMYSAVVIAMNGMFTTFACSFHFILYF